MIASWLACSAPVEEVGASWPGGDEVRAWSWENGLRLVVLPDDAVPVAAVQLWLDVGSSADPREHSGVAHLFEHLQFRATPQWPDGGFEDRQARRGAVGINATTWRDAMAFVSAVPGEAVVPLLRDERARLDGVLLTPESVAAERGVVAEERRARAIEPMTALQDLLWRMALGDHAYGRSLVGDHVGDVDLIAAQAFRSAFLTPDHLTIVVVGDVDPPLVMREVDDLFGDMRSGPPSPPGPLPTWTIGQHVGAALNAGGERVLLGLPLPPASSADAPLVSLLDLALTGGQSAPLPRALEDGGLTTSVGSRALPLRQGGVWEFGAEGLGGVSSGQIEDAIRSVLAAPLSDEDLARARAQQRTATWSQVSDAAGRAAWLGWAATVTGDWRHGIDALDRVGDASDDALRQAAARWLDPSRAVVVRTERHRRPPPTSPRAIAPPSPLRLPPGRLPRPPDGQGPREEAPAGLAVHLEPDNAVPLVWLRVGWRTGSADDLEPGATWTAARSLLRGGGSWSRDALERAAEYLGLRISIDVDAESVWLSARGPAHAWPQMASLVGEIIAEPHADAGARDAVLGERINLLRRRAADPVALAASAFHLARHGSGHPYARSPLGRADVATLDPVAWAAVRARLQNPDVVSVAGDIDDGVLDDIRRWRRTGVSRPLPQRPVDPTNFRRIVLVDAPFGPAAIRIGGPALEATDPDLPAFALALDALAAGSASGLSRALRHDRGLVYTISGELVPRSSGRGSWSVAWTTAESRVGETIALAEAVLDGGPLHDDIIRAREGAGHVRLWSAETAPGRAAGASVRLLTGWNEVAHRARMAEATGPESVWARVADRSDRLIVAVGPRAMLEQQLRALGPVEVWDRARVLRE